ncbi:hypothetical protein [Amycolatopsis silviterrae]|uniref:Uncharacterized protein n=1 Tax=Amycolatopsis silviterrae TaxID=1656914 RepID=A0ABW5HPF1_9PSEU
MRRQQWPLWPAAVVLTTAVAGCTSSPGTDPAASEAACVRDKTPYSVNASRYADVGKLDSANGTSRPFVIVLDEQHASRVGQVEIAIMLNRLYHQDHLRRLALEGSVVEKKAPDVGWFTSKPDAGTRTAVALQLLREGEVSAADFAAMALPGFIEQPIEKSDQYDVELSTKANQSLTGYLVAIAATTMTSDQNLKANDLLDQKKDEEAIKFIIGTSPWASQRYQVVKRLTPIVTNEEMQRLAAELEQKATEVNADVTAYRADLQEAKKFFDVTVQRSNAMAENTIKLAADSVGECAPIAVDIGAAHTTEVADFLRRKNMSYAAVSPASLSTNANSGAITRDALHRKGDGKSVDPAGGVGSFLDGRHKPPPVVDQDWFKEKADLAYASVVLARAAGGGMQPPFGLDEGKLGLGGGAIPPSIKIDLPSIQLVPRDDKSGTDVLFKVTMTKQNLTLWMKAGVVAKPTDPSGQESLEAALKRMRDELSKKATPEEDPKGKVTVSGLSGDVNGAVGRSKEEVSATKLAG